MQVGQKSKIDDECTSASQCTKYQSRYEFDDNNKCILSNDDNTKSLAINAIVLSSIAIAVSIGEQFS